MVLVPSPTLAYHNVDFEKLLKTGLASPDTLATKNLHRNARDPRTLVDTFFMETRAHSRPMRGPVVTGSKVWFRD